MAQSTIRDLLQGAARLCNLVQLNEPLTSEMESTMLYSLNQMIDSFSNNRLLIYNIKEYVFPLVGGQQTYTLGLGGDWNISRPMKIETAYTRLNNGTQQQLDIALAPLTVQEYASVSVKNTPSTFPFSYYDDGNYPLRNITLFPIPTGPADIVLWLRDPLADLSNRAIFEAALTEGGTGYTDGYYPDVNLAGGSGSGAQANLTVVGGVVTSAVLTSSGQNYAAGDTLTALPNGQGFILTVTFVTPGLDDPVIFPPGYERFLRFSLAVEVAPEFGKELSPTVIEIANNAKLELERLNSVPRYRKGDGNLSGPMHGRGGYFNYITGNFVPFGNGGY